MRMLYALQGTGNGHLARALQIVPWLKEEFDQVDVLMSGIQTDIKAEFELKYRFHGLSFVFGKNGGVSYVQSAKQSKPFRLLQDIRTIDLSNYDVILNDFEPITAWACKRNSWPILGLSHQAAVIHKDAPKAPKVDRVANWILHNYAPAKQSIGFHFEPFADNILPPILTNDIFEGAISNKDHITVYLPAYSNTQLIQFFKQVPELNFECFSKHCRVEEKGMNYLIKPINREAYTESLKRSKMAFLGAGFEGPSEALALGKKLLVIPMSNQYEQHLNAMYLNKMGYNSALQLNAEHTKEVLLKTFNDQSKVEPLRICQKGEFLSKIIDQIRK